MNSTPIIGTKKEKSTKNGMHQWDESESIIYFEIAGVTNKFRVAE